MTSSSQRKLASKYISYVVLSIAVIIIDIFTKYYAVNHWQETPLVVTPWLTFTTVFNRGISWGILSKYNNTLITIAIVLAICGVLFFLIRHLFEQLSFARNCLGEFLVLAGALSNLIDRAIYPGVVDFILLSHNNWHFPIFNIADISICIGVFLMAHNLFKK